MIRFLTTADTEMLAASKAVADLPDEFPSVTWANPTTAGDTQAFLDATMDGARVVLLRLLGGAQAWSSCRELQERCQAEGIALLAFGGEATPDPEMTALSTVSPGIVAEAFEYLRLGGVANTEQLLRFVADAVLLEGFGFEPPQALADHGLFRPELYVADPDRPTVGVVFYRTHWMSGNTRFIDSLCEAIEAEGANARPVFCYSLRAEPGGELPVMEYLSDVDALIVTVLASGGSNAADAFEGAGVSRPERWSDWSVPFLEDLDIPIIQGICATTTRQAWSDSSGGLTPLDAAMQVAIPEFDGRITGVPFSFKQEVEPGVRAYEADTERATRLAQIAVAQASLRRKPLADRRVAIMLSGYPTKHSRVGNAVGLDTPASAIRLLEALGEAGYAVEDAPDDGDTLIHALIAAGGHDTEFLTEQQLATATARVPAATYETWFEELPKELQEDMVTSWGPAPGELYVHDGEIVISGLAYGNIFVCIQPPRGFGENPIAIYHDPVLAPSHHYLAGYRWLQEEFGADAIVHLGKHGTLEWLPGKGLGLSETCAPDAILRGTPLLYPFIVNDPGEGTQAKRRAHAVVIDHLVPAMMRAETYDDLAKLEQLLDEYAQVASLDPAKAPEVRTQIWDLVRQAELHHDMGLDERPDDFDDFILHLDGYLCEIKDVRIKDGLHILGQEPLGEQRIGLVAALLRFPQGEGLPGIRDAVAGMFGLSESDLLARAGEAAPEAQSLIARVPGVARTCGDLIDRLEDASIGLLEAMESKGWDPQVAGAVAVDLLGAADAGVVRVLEFAATEVVPRLIKTEDEVENLLHGLDGGFVPSGPSGSPTRGVVNVLPTGRNFYSVDPKALPSRLALETGQRLAEDLLARSLSEDGAYPDSVGIIVWGTSAMRTQGDDIGEIFALLGVRPVWDERSRRVTGLEVISLEELGRPRIDVTVRISGFFRDAFPNLIGLMDEAVRTVAGLDESDEDNFVARHARQSREAGSDERRSTTRIFGSKPGAYGAGLLPLIDARNWRDGADLAQVYEVWGGYAYGQGMVGTAAPEAMRENFARIKVAVKNVDTFEHDLLDSDDYFQYHGGMVAAVREITGTAPRAFIADSSDPASVKTRDLAEEIRRVVRARVVNPRWVASMRRHGYKGAFELSATVDYLFGYDATTDVVEDWVYEQVGASYVFDPQTAEFMRESNPWAARAITERLLEAADRGLWENPDAETIAKLRAAYLDLEGELEGDAS